MARPPKEIDTDTVEKLASIHCTMKEIASVVGCSVDTLERRFADVIKEGKDRGKASLRRLQWQSAQKGSVPMLIWLGKNILGQKDKSQEEIDAARATAQTQSFDPRQLLDLIEQARKGKQNGTHPNGSGALAAISPAPGGYPPDAAGERQAPA